MATEMSSQITRVVLELMVMQCDGQTTFLLKSIYFLVIGPGHD